MRWSKLAAVGICIIVAHEMADEEDEPDGEAGAAAASAHGKVSPGKVAANTEETIDFSVDPMAYIEHNARSFFADPSAYLFPAAGAAAKSADGKVSPDKVAADTEEKKIDFFEDPEAYIKQNWRSFLMPCLYALIAWQWFNKKKEPEAEKLGFADEDGDDIKFELDGSTLTCAVKERTWTGKWIFDNKTGLLKCQEKKERIIVKVPKDKRTEVQSLVEKSKGSIGVVRLKSDKKNVTVVD